MRKTRVLAFLVVAVMFAPGCGSESVDVSESRHESIAARTGHYCQFVQQKGKVAELEMDLNAQVATHCAPGHTPALTQFTVGEIRGIMFCCSKEVSEAHTSPWTTPSASPSPSPSSSPRFPLRKPVPKALPSPLPSARPPLRRAQPAARTQPTARPSAAPATGAPTQPAQAPAPVQPPAAAAPPVQAPPPVQNNVTPPPPSP